MINPDDLFKEDPIFTSLRALAVQPNSDQIPQDLLSAFNAHTLDQPRIKYGKRTLFALLAASVVLPSLSYAQLLPNPVDQVVKSVQQLVTAPIKSISNLVVELVTSPEPNSPTKSEQDKNGGDGPDSTTENQDNEQDNPDPIKNRDEDGDPVSEPTSKKDKSPSPRSEGDSTPTPAGESQGSEDLSDHNPLSNGDAQRPEESSGD